MSQELLNLLGIKPGLVKTDAPTDNRKPAAKVSGGGQFVLVLDKWDIARGEQCLRESRHFENTTAHEAADFFAVYFQATPVETGDCHDAERAQFLQDVMSSGDYRAIKVTTTHNPVESLVAAGVLAKAFAKQQEQEQENPPEEKQGGKPGAGLRGQVAAAKCLNETGGELERLKSIQGTFGSNSCGSTTSRASSMSLENVTDIFERIQSNPKLRAIMDLAGSYRRCAQGQQRGKTSHGHDEIVGIEMDNDVSRLLAVELSKMADPELELDLMRRFVERQTLCQDVRSPEKTGRGPIVVCVDESGSMRKDGRIYHAKAFALAMLWIARHQNRHCVLSSFAKKVGTHLIIPPTGDHDEALLDWLEHFYSGGTTYDYPLFVLPKIWDTFELGPGKADFILLTDGVCPVTEYMEEYFLAWKAKQQCAVRSLIIGSRNHGEIDRVSDYVHTIDSMTLGEESVRDCMAI